MIRAVFTEALVVGGLIFGAAVVSVFLLLSSKNDEAKEKKP